jgi:CRISPR/Cas system CMR-associated protein Cmr5 small subunit
MNYRAQLAFYELKVYNTQTKLNIVESAFTFSDNKLLNFLPKERLIEPTRLRLNRKQISIIGH